MKSYYVYVIECDCGKRYIGISENIYKRLYQHNSGFSKWTKRYKNWEIIYKEKVSNLTEARKRENYLKRLKSGNQFRKIIGS